MLAVTQHRSKVGLPVGQIADESVGLQRAASEIEVARAGMVDRARKDLAAAHREHSAAEADAAGRARGVATAKTRSPTSRSES